MGSYSKPCKTCRTYFWGFPLDEECWNCRPSTVVTRYNEEKLNKQKYRLEDSGEVELILEDDKVVEEED